MKLQKIGLMVTALFIIVAGGLTAQDKITVMTNRSDIVTTVWKQIADSYTKKTGVAVEFRTQPDWNILKQGMAAKNLPDVFMMTPDIIPETFWAQWMEPLDDLAVIKNKELIDGPVFTSKGHTYAIGQTKSVGGLIYNRAVLKKAGITSQPKSIEELMADLDKIQATGATPFTFIPSAGWTLTQVSQIANQYSMALGLSGNYKNDMAKIDNPCSIDQPLGKAAWLMYQIAKKGYTGTDPMSLSWDNSKRELAQGNIAMVNLGSWLPTQIVDSGAAAEDVGMMPLPVTNAKGQIFATADFDNHFAVWKDSKQKVNAKKFLDFLFGDKEAYALWMDNFGKTSLRKDMKDTAPALVDFEANKPVIREIPTTLPEFNAIQNKAKFDDQAIGAAAVAATSDEGFKAAMDDFNKRWAAARKAVK